MTKEVDIVSVKEEKAIDTFISSAIEKGLPVETMEKLFALREKARAEFAREQFVIDMAKFQAECPIIIKETVVNDKTGKERYRYAKISSIVEQTKKSISDNNFSYDFVTEDLIEGSEKFIRITCNVTHKFGHTKPSSIKIPIGAEAFMTDVQKYGARITFGKRYAFCNAFGITTGDEDDDSNNELNEDLEKKETETVSVFQLRLEKCKNDEELKAVWSQTPPKVKEKLKTIKDQLKEKYAKNKVSDEGGVAPR